MYHLAKHYTLMALTAVFLLVLSTGNAAPGDYDSGFSAGIWNTVTDDPIVYTAVEQPDGKIVIGGDFDSCWSTTRNYITRVNDDGSLDSGFDANLNGVPWCIVLLDNGQMYIAGQFTTVGGVSRSDIALLDTDGSLETGFAPSVNDDINVLAVQADGKVLIGGKFTSANSTTRNRIARLNTDGTLDTSFNPNANGEVTTLLVQPDGKILVGGAFSTIAGASRSQLARLNSDGTNDSSFSSGVTPLKTPAMALMPDGKIMTCYDAASYYPTVFRLNPGGSYDFGFSLSDYSESGTTSSYEFNGMSLLADGNPFMTGTYHSGTTLARIDPASSFTYVALGTTAYGSTIQKDGKILIAGKLDSGGSIQRYHSGIASETLRTTGSDRIEWIRNGYKPMTTQVKFELSTNSGATWSALGNGAAITDGWQLTGLSLPASGQIRATAYIMGGYRGMSRGIIQSVLTTFEPEISVEGNGQPIVHPDVYPSLEDHTDFGDVSVSIGSRTRTFTIRNQGPAPLTVTGISVGGPDPTVFSTGGITLPTVVYSGAPQTFTVTYDASVPPYYFWLQQAEITVTSDDSDESNFRFYVQGWSAEPEIEVTGNGTVITAGDSTPSATDHTDFGTPAGGDPSAGRRTFTIRSLGATYLTLQSVTIISGSSDFYIDGISYPDYIFPGSSSDTRTFSVGFNPSTSSGLKTAVIRIVTNDGDEDPFDFTVQAVATPRDVNVTGGGISIADGDTTPSLSDETDFGPAMVTGEQIATTFSLQNTGSNTLSISSVSISGTHAGDFTLSGSGLLAPLVSFSNRPFTITFDPSATGIRTATVTVVSNDPDEGTYDFTIQGRGATPGLVGPSHDIDANGTVLCSAQQPDGKTLVGGSFTTLGGLTHNYLARLNADGTVDTTFTPDVNGAVRTIALQKDGNILIGGAFSTVDSTTRHGFARLFSDGLLDTSFATVGSFSASVILIQPDGKIVIGGSFIAMYTTRNYLARFSAGGSLDSGFNPDPNDLVHSMVLQPDGKLIITGDFTTIGGVSRNHIARLNADATLDTGYNPGADGVVLTAALQQNGKTVIGGDFSTVAATSRTRLARLNADGSLDTGFNIAVDAPVHTMGIQWDGKIIIGGEFTTVGGTSRDYAARIDSGGTLDTTFDAGANGEVYSLGQKIDGSLLVGGDFTTLAGSSRNRFGSLDNNLGYYIIGVSHPSYIDVWGTGSTPLLHEMFFEYSEDGITWTDLGPGTKASSYWEYYDSNASLPLHGYIRVRGRQFSGNRTASGGIIELLQYYDYR